MNTEKVTHKCYTKLVEEANYIKKKLIIEIKKRIIEARQQGDFSENGELQSELKAKVEAENRLEKIEKIINTCEVIELQDIFDKTKVQFGAEVALEMNLDGQKKDILYHIVGLIETNIQENKIYYKSPIAQKIIGKSIGDIFELNGRTYKINSISYANISN